MTIADLILILEGMDPTLEVCIRTDDYADELQPVKDVVESAVFLNEYGNFETNSRGYDEGVEPSESVEVAELK